MLSGLLTGSARRNTGIAESMSTPFVKIFGERNTATNALKALIETNSASRALPGVSSEIDPAVVERLRALRQAFAGKDPLQFLQAREHEIDRVFLAQPPSHAWKHIATRFDTVESLAGALVVFCVRHPLSWLLALYRNPYHLQAAKPESFDQFLDTAWPLTQRDNLTYAALLPHQLYEEKLQSYAVCMRQLEAAGIAYRVLKFEDIVLQQEAVFASLADQLCNPAAQCSPVVRSTKDSSRTLHDYIAYYGAERWRDEIADQIPRINGHLNSGLLAQFGYCAG